MKKLLLLLALLCASTAYGQTVTLSPVAVQQFFDGSGRPLSGGQLFTYAAGTSTPQATYTDSTGITANTNPLILNAGGFPVNASNAPTGIWLTNAVGYKIVAKNAGGVVQWTVDNIFAPGSGGSGGGGGTIIGSCGTVNTLALFTTSSVLGCSLATDNGTALTYVGTGGVNLNSAQFTGTSPFAQSGTEGPSASCPAPTAGKAMLCWISDLSPHGLYLSDDGGAYFFIGQGTGTVTSITASGCATVSPNPITTTGNINATGCLSASTSPVKRIILPFGSCLAGTAASAWDTPVSNAAVSACKTGGTNNTVQATLQFADAQLAYYSGIVPSDWVSWNISRIAFTTSDTTNGHTIIFNLALACDAPNTSVVDDPAYGTANAYTTVTIGGGAVANASYQTSTGNLSGGGCAAGSIFHLKLIRATDTSTDTSVAATGWLEVLYNGGFN